ncbi:uncharacterized protein LOC143247247 isoform X2 [Tachypleus tridentatus]|uniref:uncharacterized protein LOC143247247 isoform X2 n=1 Tax=Tachypleus tridentatus TaxID=6853 RepID=UPI003FD063EC
MAGKKDGVIYDSRTNRALASDQPNLNQDLLKEKIRQVKEVISYKSNDDIVLVLQYYDYDVTQTISAFMEDGATKALNEWTCKGNVNRFKGNNKNKKSKKKRNKKDPAGKNLSFQVVDTNPESEVRNLEISVNNRLENGDIGTVEPINSDINGSSWVVPLEAMTTADTSCLTSVESHQQSLPSEHLVAVSTDSPVPQRNHKNYITSDTCCLTSEESHKQPLPSERLVAVSTGSPLPQRNHKNYITSDTCCQPSGESHQQPSPSECLVTSPSNAPLPTRLHKNEISEKNIGVEINVPTNATAPCNKTEPENMHTDRAQMNLLEKASLLSTKTASLEFKASSNRQRSTNSFSSVHSTSEDTAVHSNTTSSNSSHGRRGLEKSIKDLSRQTVALQRVQNLLEEEITKSYKRIKNAVQEVQNQLAERQAELILEMEKVKKDAKELLTQRQEMATVLKNRADHAEMISEVEWNELRADIKHFVVERKLDEDLGKTLRFLWDRDRILEAIKKFGEIQPVKNMYGHRRHSVSSGTGLAAVDPNNQDDDPKSSGLLSTNDDSTGVAVCVADSTVNLTTVQSETEETPEILSNTRWRGNTGWCGNRSGNYQFYRGGRGRGNFVNRGRGQQNQQSNRGSGGSQSNYSSQGWPLRTEGRPYASQTPRNRDRFYKPHQHFSDKQSCGEPKNETVDNRKPNPSYGSGLINGTMEHHQ